MYYSTFYFFTGYTNSKDEASLIYDEAIRLETEIKSTIVSTNLECMWMCPEPEMGNAVVCVNLRLRDSDKWHRLTYSMRESAIRWVILVMLVMLVCVFSFDLLCSLL